MKKIIIKLISKIVVRVVKWYSAVSIDDSNIYNDTNGFSPGTIIRITKWGKYSSCNSDSIVVRATIGNYSMISHHVTIGPRDHIFTNFSIHDAIYSKTKEHLYNTGIWDNMYRVKIGHDVWIGSYSIVLRGVEIGNGAIVGAGSVVTKSIPAYAFVAGNPARIIRYRFSEEQIRKLESLKWFEWDLDKILEEKDSLEKLVGFKLSNFIARENTRREYLSS
ncbi:MAG: CatB-related O-acetyltransferase [Desulfobacterales bacterium]|nr:CatB-related O-acetyltransferase [Desulfobacterales bacterium]